MWTFSSEYSIYVEELQVKKPTPVERSQVRSEMATNMCNTSANNAKCRRNAGLALNVPLISHG